MCTTAQTLVCCLLCCASGALALRAALPHPAAAAQQLSHPPPRRTAPALALGRRSELAHIRMQTEPKAAETNAEAEDGSGGIRQLLGLKGATEATGEEFLNWKIRLQVRDQFTVYIE
jgi:hypothetical protein